MLTSEEKVRLADEYAPILFFHRDEKYEPIRPDRYMSSSAMWLNKPVGDRIFNWGNEEDQAGTDFPRDALIPRSKIGVNAEDAEAENDTFIGSEGEDGFRTYQVSNEERELFIQQVSWSVGGSDSEFANAAENFREKNGFKEITPSFFVDVRDQDDIGAVPRDAATPLPPGFENALRSIYRSGFWLITYRFFFAYHEETLTDCEIDSEVIRAKRAESFHAHHIHGSFEGDWHAVSVIVETPPVLPVPGAPTGLPPMPMSPLDLTDFPRPDFSGYSRRARGVLVNIGSGIVDSRNFSIMKLANVAAGDARFTGNHLQTYVARGTHNMYASPGRYDAPKFDSTLPLPIELIDTCILADNVALAFNEVEAVTEKIGNVVSTGKKAAISLAKIGAGAAVGGVLFGPVGALFGAWGGAMASAIEGLLCPPPDTIPGQPSPPPGPNNVPDVGPTINEEDDLPDFGTVIAPESVADRIRDAFGTNLTELKIWEGPTESRIIDRTDGVQPWWEPDGNHPQGYRGLWGARVTSDPFNRRRGSRIPAYEALFVNAILTNQE